MLLASVLQLFCTMLVLYKQLDFELSLSKETRGKIPTPKAGVLLSYIVNKRNTLAKCEYVSKSLSS